MKIRIKHIYWLTLILPLRANGQAVPEALKTFPAHTIIRVQNVMKLVTLTTQQMKQVGQYYNRQDSLAETIKVTQGATFDQIRECYDYNTQQLAGILTPLQMNELNAPVMNNNTSEFTKAIRYRAQLGLDQTQVDKLLTACVAANKDVAQSQGKNFSRLQQILTENQVKQYFSVTNSDKAFKISQDYWQQLKKQALVHHADSIKVNALLLKYTLAQLEGQDMVTYIYPAKADSVRKATITTRPYVLWKLNAYRNNLGGSLLGTVISYREKIHLRGPQIDSLIMYAIVLEKQNSNNNFRFSSSFLSNNNEQVAAMIRILDDSQYTRYLEIKNYDHSLFNADKDWDALKKAGMIAPGTDSVKLMNQNQAYELRWLVINEKVSQSKDPQVIFQKQEVEAGKPELLAKLYGYEHETADKRTKETFAW